MIPKEFTDVLLLMIGDKQSFKYVHIDHLAKSYKTLDGKIFNIDLTKAYNLRGSVPWKLWNWRTPWSVASEWLWKIDHRVALLIYPDANVDEKSGMVEPVSTFDYRKGDFEGISPRGLEGFVESRVPVNYFKKWTTGSGKIPWWVWVLVAVLIVVMFYMFVSRS